MALNGTKLVEAELIIESLILWLPRELSVRYNNNTCIATECKRMIDCLPVAWAYFVSCNRTVL